MCGRKIAVIKQLCAGGQGLSSRLWESLLSVRLGLAGLQQTLATCFRSFMGLSADGEGLSDH